MRPSLKSLAWVRALASRSEGCQGTSRGICHKWIFYLSVVPHLCWHWPIILIDSICRMRSWGNDWQGADSFWTPCAPRRVLSVAYHPTSLALQGSQSQPWSLGPRRNSNLLSSPRWQGCDGPSYTPGLCLPASRLSPSPPTPSPSLSYGAVIPRFPFAILDPRLPRLPIL